MRYPTDYCKNCEKKYRKDFKFCPHCGQQTNDELTVALLFYNTITNYFSFDARFIKSIVPLLFKPGYLPKVFIEVKRSIYLHPGQLYLFISVLFFFLTTTFVIRDNVRLIDNALKNPTFITTSQVDSLLQETIETRDSLLSEPVSEKVFGQDLPPILTPPQTELDTLADVLAKDGLLKINDFNLTLKTLDSLLLTEATDEEILIAMGMKEDISSYNKKIYLQTLKLYKQRTGGKLVQNIYEKLPFALFILLPIFALLLKLFFFKRGPYSFHLVFSFYFFSFLFFILTLLLLFNQFLSFSSWIDWLIIWSTGFYLILAIRRFYQSSWSTTILKIGALSFIYLLFIISIALALVSVYGFLMY